MKFRNHYNFKLTSADLEKGGGKSQTVPNQTLPLSEILKRFTRGVIPPTRENQFHEDDELMDEILKMDPLEKLDLAENIRQGIKSHQEQNVSALNAEADRVSPPPLGGEQVREAT